MINDYNFLQGIDEVNFSLQQLDLKSKQIHKIPHIPKNT